MQKNKTEKFLEVFLSLFLGLLAGFLGTATHIAMIYPIPVGLLLSFVFVIATLVWWHNTTESIKSFLLMGLAMIVATLLILFFPGDSTVIPGDLQSYFWIFGLPICIFISFLFIRKQKPKQHRKQVYPNPLEGLK
ncbi:MAG: hypothetical protein QM613_00615 [Micrococcaceae bacterium]